MKEFIEARKINPTETDTTITMEWDVPIDQKEKDTKDLSKTDKETKIKAFKELHGTGYKYFKHTCNHDGENKPCALEEI
jgi:hypothetical protein